MMAWTAPRTYQRTKMVVVKTDIAGICGSCSLIAVAQRVAGKTALITVAAQGLDLLRLKPAVLCLEANWLFSPYRLFGKRPS